ncbi:MAG TPA: DUF5985 family protein [Burkholderiales bacterium]|nr:DUF5985 family protein [Burkholderiales bacterium]
MIDFLSGAVTLAYVVATLYFVHFWRRTSDRLFLAFALAFALLALNQVTVFTLGVDDERYNYAYILRVLGFVLILVAIIDKNVFAIRRRE